MESAPAIRPFTWKLVPPIGSFPCQSNSFPHGSVWTKTRSTETQQGNSELMVFSFALNWMIDSTTNARGSNGWLIKSLTVVCPNDLRLFVTSSGSPYFGKKRRNDWREKGQQGNKINTTTPPPPPRRTTSELLDVGAKLEAWRLKILHP